MAIIGIDLGTTYSAAARCVDGKPEIIMLEGDPTLPSVVSLLRGGNIVVGRAAKRNQANAPHNTIIEVKRKMGLNTEVPLGEKKFSPQQISAMVLKKIKEQAEQYLGEEVTGAVISCPAYFKDPQRAATKEAGQIAGLNVLQIINEPTAAAYAYGVQQGTDGGGKGLFLVYDLGGGTFDVTVIRMAGANLEVIGTGGDPELGGGNFDDCIVEWMLQCLEAKNPGYLSTITDEKKPALKLRLKSFAEEGKKQLCNSSSGEYPFQIPQIDVYKGKPLPFIETLTLAKFEELIKKLLENSLSWIDEAFKMPREKHKLGEENLTAVLLVGGSTRVPLVRKLLEKRFEKTKTPIWGQEKGINPDEIVALGASLLAASADPDSDETPQKILVDVTGHTLSVAAYDRETDKAYLCPIILKESRIPCKQEHRFASHGEGQRQCRVEVYQGEGVQMNGEGVMKIGEFLIEIAPIKESTPLRIGLELDINGLLIGRAVDELSGREVRCDLAYNGKTKLSENELKQKQSELEAQLNSVLRGGANPLDAKPAANPWSEPPAAAPTPPPMQTPPPAPTPPPAAAAPTSTASAAGSADVTSLMNPIMRNLYNKAVGSFDRIPADKQAAVWDLVSQIEEAARAGDARKLMSFFAPLNQLLQGI